MSGLSYTDNRRAFSTVTVRVARSGAIVAMLALATSAAAAQGAPEVCASRQAESMVALVDRHVAWHAESAVRPDAQDIYKLLYHATLGSEHAVTDTAMASAYMRRELQALEPVAAQELVVDTLGTDFARVNLRPFVARGGDTDRLLAAFVRTASRTMPRASLHCATEAVVRHVGSRWPWSADRLRRFFDAQRRGGDTAVHHSRAYSARYRPAYRVVALSELPALLAGLRPAK